MGFKRGLALVGGVALLAGLAHSSFGMRAYALRPYKVQVKGKVSWAVIAPARVQPLAHLATGIALDGEGNAYVTDSLEGRLKKISPTGKVLGSWGANQSGKLHWYPTGVAVGPQGNIYVLTPDQEPYDVQVGTHITEITAEGKFVRRREVVAGRCIAAGAGSIFVAVLESRVTSGVRAHVFKFAPNGRWLATWYTPYLADEEAEPNGMAVGSKGDVYLTVATNNPTPKAGPFITRHLYRFSPSGRVSQVKTGVPLGSLDAIDAQGNLYLALSQYEGAGIEKISPKGRLLARWLATGGQQLGEVHVALDRAGNVFVTDTHNINLTSGWADATVIDVLSPTGRFLKRWGSFPSAKSLPLGMRLTVGPLGGLYATSWQHGFMTLSPNGRTIRYFGRLATSAQGIARDAHGNVYIDVSTPPRIYKYDPSGRFLAQFAASDHAYPALTGMTVDRLGNLYVIDGSSVSKISPSGRIVASIGSPGIAPGQLSAPQAITTDGSGNLYVADTQNNRIEEFSPAGQFLQTWGSSSNLDRPIGVAVDRVGHIFALEPIRDDIVEFAPSGSILARFGAPGVLKGQLSEPTDIAAGPKGSLYVLDYGNNRVQTVRF